MYTLTSNTVRLVVQANSKMSKQEVDENSCNYCLSGVENMLQYKYKGYRNFRRQMDRIISNNKLLGMLYIYTIQGLNQHFRF